MLFTDVIRAKRDGEALNDEQIQFFVDGLADGSIPAEQVSALAMAVFLNSMTFEETGKLTNHRDIRSIHDRTVSYAGFLHAWSTGMIRRAPLFVEVRDAEERRRTARLLRPLFEPA